MPLAILLALIAVFAIYEAWSGVALGTLWLLFQAYISTRRKDSPHGR